MKLLREKANAGAKDSEQPRGRMRSIARFLATLAFIALVVGAASFSGVLGPSGGSSSSDLDESPAPPGLEDAVARVFDGKTCVTAAIAESAIRADLNTLGFSGWIVTVDAGLRPSGCVTASIQTDEHRVLLMMASRPEVIQALRVVADDLLSRCLNKQQAIDLVTAALTGLGETGWELRTDGPVGGPMDRKDEILRHYEAGCFIYSGTGWTADGKRLYYIAGRT